MNTTHLYNDYLGTRNEFDDVEPNTRPFWANVYVDYSYGFKRFSRHDADRFRSSAKRRLYCVHVTPKKVRPA